MDEQTLYERQNRVKVAFDDLSTRKAQKDTEVDEMVIEMNRLQGEWRLLDAMRKEHKSMAGAKTTQADPASTLPDPEPDLAAMDIDETPKAKVTRGRK